MNNYYELFLQSAIRYAVTVGIKLTDVAKCVNRGVIADGLSATIDPIDHHTWKYYQNIVGVAHHSKTWSADPNSLSPVEGVVWYEEPILVTSLIHGREVEFTLCRDPYWVRGDVEDWGSDTVPAKKYLLDEVTRQAYQFGGRYYRELIQSHPTREAYINAVLNQQPNIDQVGWWRYDEIEAAIQAKEGQIVHHRADLIEPQEVSLRADLQEWIYKYVFRWVNRGYAITDDLYTATYLAQLTLNLIPALITLRLDRCRTAEAHSFHVRSYLASHCGMDQWLEVLTQEQQGFFYRNIQYLQRHAGKSDTFDWLIENVMQSRGFPVYAYQMQLSEAKMLPQKEGDPINYQPEPVFTRISLNEHPSNYDDGRYTFDEIHAKLNPQAELNEDYLYYHRDRVLNPLVTSSSGEVPTKVVESVYKYYDESAPYTRPWMALQHWGWLASQGVYLSTLTTTLPGREVMVQLTALEGYLLWLYCFLRGHGVLMTKIPPLFFEHVCRKEENWADSIRDRVNPKTLPEWVLERFKKGNREIVVPDLFGSDSQIGTVEGFSYLLNVVHSYYRDQYRVAAVQESAYAYCSSRLAAGQFWADYWIQLEGQDGLVTGKDASQWLLSKGLEFDDYAEEDFRSLADWLQVTFTGLKLSDSADVRRVQKGLVEILKSLSSYSISFISDAASTDIALLHGACPRFSYTRTQLLGANSYEAPMVTSSVRAASAHLDLAPADYNSDYDYVQSHERNRIVIDLNKPRSSASVQTPPSTRIVLTPDRRGEIGWVALGTPKFTARTPGLIHPPQEVIWEMFKESL